MAIRKIQRKLTVRFQVLIRGSDGRWISRVFATKREAVSYEASLKNRLCQGDFASASLNRITLDEFYIEWALKKKSASAGWLERRHAMYLRYISPVIGSRKLITIKPHDVSAVISKMVDQGKSPQTCRHVFNLLRNMFGDAVESFEYLRSNPAKRALKPAVPLKEAQHLSLEEIKRLLAHVHCKPYEIPIALGVFMGLRMGEIQALRWMDIEFERKILHVRRTYVRLEQCFKDFPKGRKQHSHRIPDELLSLLLEASKNQRTENLVASTKEGRVLDYGYFRKALKRYCKEAGVKIVAAHGLRHSTSELYMAHGATRDDLRLLYGHSDHRTTDRYIHDNGDRLSAVAKVIRLRP